MTLGELSQRMMVSNGNITGLVHRLAAQGLITRRPSPKDRRVQIVSLTAEGRRFFRTMARVNADWIGEIFAGLDAGDVDELIDRKSTRLNSSHGYISYAVFCLKKKKKLRYRTLDNSRL